MDKTDMNENFTDERNLLSLELITPVDDSGSIWAKLRKAIENQVRKDGVRKDAVLPSEIEADVFKRIVDYIYSDVSEFYYWLFSPQADYYGISDYILSQPATGDRYTGEDYDLMRKAVEPVVEDNLAAMRDANEIPPGQDVEGLSEKITNNLTTYIMNWQDWFYGRKIDDDLDAYDEYQAENASIYTYDDYGDLTNILDNSQYDNETDLPYPDNL
jgi:hypothetical protein